MYAASWNFSIETHKLIRILLIAAILTVGTLQVTKCSNDDDYESVSTPAGRYGNLGID